jgi:Domain of unknown function (DUF4382)
MWRRNVWTWIGLTIAILVFAACGGGGGGDGSSGTLSVSLSDSALPGFQAIYVTVDEVQAHRSGGGGWVTVGTPNKTVDLLTLINGVREELGVAELATGHYTQLRLLLGSSPDAGLNLLSETHPFANYFIDDTDTAVELKVPSGLQTGIKIVNGFNINENQTTELILDFDAMRSVVNAGSSGKWLLKPTIKVLDTASYSIASGTVRDGADAGIEGVMVSAQSFDDTATDERDEVIVEAATITDADGNYKLFLAPGDYNLVAFRSSASDADGPACTQLSAQAETVHSADFALTFTDQIGTIDGTVTITDSLTDQHATLSFRQVVSCGAASPSVELLAVNVAAGGTYGVDLPAEDYRVVASTYDRATQAVNATVTSGGETTVDFDF